MSESVAASARLFHSSTRAARSAAVMAPARYRIDPALAGWVF